MAHTCYAVPLIIYQSDRSEISSVTSLLILYANVYSELSGQEECLLILRNMENTVLLCLYLYCVEIRVIDTKQITELK